eukprot:6883641-Prymnesium_polylepis.1
MGAVVKTATATTVAPTAPAACRPQALRRRARLWMHATRATRHAWRCTCWCGRTRRSRSA